MAFPTVVLTGTYQRLDKSPHSGSVQITASQDPVADAAGNVVLAGILKATLDAAGKFTVALPATDSTALSVQGFTYLVQVVLYDSTLPPVRFELPASLVALDMADVSPSVGTPTPPTVSIVTKAAFDTLVSRVGVVEPQAAAAVVTSAADASAKDTAHTSAADPHPGYETAAEAQAKATAAQTAAIAASAQRASNLSDLASAATARTNLGLGTAATQASGAFDTAGAATAAQAAAAADASAKDAAHVAAADPHPVYLTQTEADGLYVPRARYFEGTGFPEGVVTAPVGSRYIDTAATTGAVEWIKATGTGNTGWKIVYGDTGWRQVTTTAAGVTGTFLVRRVGEQVSVADFGTMAAGATVVSPEQLYTLPVGWRPVTTARYLFAQNGAVPTKLMVVTSTGTMPVYTVAASQSVQLAAPAWTTREAWPTTLPGVAY